MSPSLDRNRRELETRGYTVLESVLDHDDLPRLRDALDDVFRAEEAIARRRGWSCESWRIAYLLPIKDPRFLALCHREPVLELARSVLGRGCVVGAMNGFEMLAGGGEQELHRDQEEATSGTLLGINAVFVLDDFHRDNGCTRFVPGSQRPSADFDPGGVAGGADATVRVEAPAGSVIAFDGALLHGGGANRAGGRRRAVHVYYTREWMRPHWDFAASFGALPARRLTAADRRLLGFDSKPLVYDAVAHRVRRGSRLGALARARSLARRWILGD